MEGKTKMGIGFDAGTYNLVCCTRDKSNDFSCIREVNAFIEIRLENRFLFNMMKDAKSPEGKPIVPLIERENVAYALGEAAVNMAYTMSDLELRRPMKEGCVNPKERDAFEIMKIMIHNMLEETVTIDNETLYYTIPANAVNAQTNVDFHSDILKAIFKAFESDKGFKVNPAPINEGLCLVYAELVNRAYTGVGISFGAGQCNVCFAIYGVPVFTFSIVNSGDWIDQQAATATGESVTFINQRKTKISLSEPPTNFIDRAIQTQYRIMIEKAVQGIKKGLVDAGKKARTDAPIDVVIAGGTSMPTGFDTVFKEILTDVNLPLSINNIVRPENPLYAVARGALIAAENAK